MGAAFLFVVVVVVVDVVVVRRMTPRHRLKQTRPLYKA